MSDEFDAAMDAEVVRRSVTTPVTVEAEAARAESRIARLASRLYASAGAVERPRMLACLLRPLGPLALVGVASGAFAGFLGRIGDRGAGIVPDDLAAVSTAQVFELARFVEQVSPDALQQFAIAIADHPLGVSAFSASVAMVLIGALRGPRRRAPERAADEDAAPSLWLTERARESVDS